ncbi:LacI family DNA-binding transcriptional regulator [Paenibacillus sp. UNC499MF]|uniref:LacI family DNA-binding transcriptional regulator n=1 Tax=Paenibacillus sp. UNC499MF TaxID=1502751 RepID=UPI00089FBC6B|nr:LacI family DNA-binding transcriptional regulator [Paenibacillus sp. UNC499MF]SEF82113.1 transcriptional regulator, LacI family [Paenibacillus sp. UNC499MF]
MANIKDIARLAGVSVTTVSRVLNDHPYVSEAKRAAVQEVVHRLNYSRNVNAVHLITGKTNMVGVVIPYLNLPYFNSIMEGIAQEALEANVHLLVSQTKYGADKETELLNMLKIKQIDGLLICSRSLEWEVIEAYSQFGPIIACEYIESDRISSVHIDHYGSFRLAMQLLLEKGHTRIGYCLGRGHSFNSRNRRRAFSDALSSAGVPVREEWMFYQIYSIEDGAEVVRGILDMDERPTALLVAGDQVAAGIISEAVRKGLRVPEDLAIVSFDNHPISQLFDITTIDNRLVEIGRTAFSLLLKRLQDPASPVEHRELPFRLIERATV